MIGSTYKINGWDETIGFNDRLTIVQCTCGITYAIPEEVERRLRQFTVGSYPQHYASTCCPNGHSWSYIGKNDEDLARQAAERRAAAAEAELTTARQQRDEARKALKRIEKRVHAGVCTECNRTFANVANHMRSKHGTPAEIAAVVAEHKPATEATS